MAGGDGHYMVFPRRLSAIPVEGDLHRLRWRPKLEVEALAAAKVVSSTEAWETEFPPQGGSAIYCAAVGGEVACIMAMGLGGTTASDVVGNETSAAWYMVLPQREGIAML